MIRLTLACMGDGCWLFTPSYPVQKSVSIDLYHDMQRLLLARVELYWSLLCNYSLLLDNSYVVLITRSHEYFDPETYSYTIIDERNMSRNNRAI